MGGVSEAEQSPVYCKALGVAKTKLYIGGGEIQNKIYMYIILITDKCDTRIQMVSKREKGGSNGRTDEH